MLINNFAVQGGNMLLSISEKAMSNPDTFPRTYAVLTGTGITDSAVLEAFAEDTQEKLSGFAVVEPEVRPEFMSVSGLAAWNGRGEIYRVGDLVDCEGTTSCVIRAFYPDVDSKKVKVVLVRDDVQKTTTLELISRTIATPPRASTLFKAVRALVSYINEDDTDTSNESNEMFTEIKRSAAHAVLEAIPELTADQAYVVSRLMLNRQASWLSLPGASMTYAFLTWDGVSPFIGKEALSKFSDDARGRAKEEFEDFYGGSAT